jgi:dUTP pyrophosphatase
MILKLLKKLKNKLQKTEQLDFSTLSNVKNAERLNTMKFKKLHENAKLPTQATEGSAGYDIYAVKEDFIASPTGPIWEYSTGVAVEIPKGFVGLLCARSSITKKTTFSLGNSVGIIDSDYRGELKFQFRDLKPPGGMSKRFDLTQAIGQLVVIPYHSSKAEFVNELSETKRGDGGFGHTDQKGKK